MRRNGRYEIIAGQTVGGVEVVIGLNSGAPMPYVCWNCRGGSDYYWGDYCSDYEEAASKATERLKYLRECLSGGTAHAGRTRKRGREYER